LPKSEQIKGHVEAVPEFGLEVVVTSADQKLGAGGNFRGLPEQLSKPVGELLVRTKPLARRTLPRE